MSTPLMVFLAIVVILVISAVKILMEYERGVVFRLGRVVAARGPGFTFIIPFIEKMTRVSLRVITMDVPPQDVITHDNVSVKVNAVVYFRVVEPIKAIIQVENYLYATSQLAQTTLRSILGQVELDDLLSDRDSLNQKLQEVLDKQTDAWGIKVTLVEVKYVDLPESMQRAMARQAEAERDRRAKVIAAEGEFQASRKLTDAADIMSTNSMSLQLRFLQTLLEISSDKSSTVLLPIPMDLIKPFLDREEKKKEEDKE